MTSERVFSRHAILKLKGVACRRTLDACDGRPALDDDIMGLNVHWCFEVKFRNVEEQRLAVFERMKGFQRFCLGRYDHLLSTRSIDCIKAYVVCNISCGAHVGISTEGTGVSRSGKSGV